ncbi:relaxase/mobilization nuclease domain-containing protein [Lactobacillaceae bacterium Melli_B3]
MAYVKSNSSTNAWGRLHYLLDEAAHDGSEHRVLSVTGANVRFWGPTDRPYRNQSGYYLNQQFKRVRHRAWNHHKLHQAQHLIVSFSEAEFSTNDPDQLTGEADQINQLVDGFMNQHFPSTQWVSVIQCDGEGHKLHAHVLINSVKPDGKCVQTSLFQVDRLRKEWNQYLDQNYLATTGQVYVNPFEDAKPRRQLTQVHGWQAALKNTLDWAREIATSIKEYLNLLEEKDVTVSERNKKGDWSYHVMVNDKEKTVRDFYQRKDRNTGEVKSTRGMGLDYTPDQLDQYFKFKKSKTKDDGSNDQEEATSGPAGRGLEKRIRDQERQNQLRFVNQLHRQSEADDESELDGHQTGYPKSRQSTQSNAAKSAADDALEL